MKRFLYIIFCIFVFSFLTIVNTDSYAIIDNNTTNKLLGSITIKNEDVKAAIEEKEKEEKVVVEEEQKEIDTGSEDEQTYEEDYSPATETNYETFGTYGRLYVSWYDVALYDYNVNTSSSASLQELVDNYDSAAYYYNKGKLVIADHNYQGFSVLGSLSEGTTSYIKFADGSTIGYSLIKKAKGYNTGPDLVDTEGNSFYDMDASLIMYTCYEDGIMVTLWA